MDYYNLGKFSFGHVKKMVQRFINILEGLYVNINITGLPLHWQLGEKPQGI